MREHAEDFAPFLGMLPDDAEYQGYCDKVASVGDAEWGGQLEIRALCWSLGRRVVVYSADSPLLTMGEEATSDPTLPPLKLAYHRHYYALGEHYNSIITKLEPCACGLTDET
jgi:OTU domain-containing protein 6